MGFFDEYVDDSPGSVYVSGDEKETLIAEGTAFTITAITFDPEGGYDDNDRYVLDIELNGAERKLSFQAGSVDSRDRMLASMAERLEREGTLGQDVKLTQQGRSTLITAA